MAFTPINFNAVVKFNSAMSSEFLDTYENHVKSKIVAKNAEPKSKTFAPSSIRCKRLSWFRLRGAQPDVIKNADIGLNFTAEIGTACHEIIQTNLVEILKDDWLSVPDHLATLYHESQYSCKANGYETQVEMFSPPIKFAVDGLISLNGKIYLLEIKTCDHGTFQDLTGPREKHIDQVRTYCTLLKVCNVIMMYQDRMYGDIKCYEISVPAYQQDEILASMKEVMRLVECNIAPDKMPEGSDICNSNMCPYYQKCKEW